MLFGVISDVHSNLEALTVALESLRDVGGIVCAGDIVGYGPNPNECCELIREKSAAVVLGNHDAVVTDRMTREWFNPIAREAAEWTRRHLSASSRIFLKDLPLVHHGKHFIMVHGSLSQPERFEYIARPSDAGPTFENMGDYTLCFIGHTHVTEYYVQKIGQRGVDCIPFTGEGTLELKPGFRYIVNCGSVGQPRDRDPRVSVGLFDTETKTIEIRRLEYPIDVTQGKMADAQLPDALSRRLDFGV